jgi:phosphoglycerate kinase
MFNKKTIKDIDVRGRVVLLRADYNVPIENGQIIDDYRIVKSTPTIQYLRERGCRVIVCSHLGRPDGQVDPALSLAPVAERLGYHLGIDVHFVPAAIGDQVRMATRAMQPRDVVLLENLRFYPEEEKNDRNFAAALAEPAEYFVQDAFGLVHRAHASMAAITEQLPSVAGLLVEEEVTVLQRAVMNPARPLVTIMGGAKIGDKIDLIDRFLRTANTIVIGGAMANTFLKATGHEVGKSLYDKHELKEAKHIIRDADRAKVELILPTIDVAVASEVSEQAERREVAVESVEKTDTILDFGEGSLGLAQHAIEHAGTVIWNGPLGMVELERFAHSSAALAQFITEKKLNCIVGGGDTAGFVHQLGLADQFTHVSTGGGASLELMAGKELPGITPLLDK